MIIRGTTTTTTTNTTSNPTLFLPDKSFLTPTSLLCPFTDRFTMAASSVVVVA